MTILNITLTNGWLIFLVIIVVVILYNLHDLSKQKDSLVFKLKEMGIMMKHNEAELKLTYQQWAIAEFEKFKDTEINAVQIAAEDKYRQAAAVLLQRWKIEEEARIRQDAINRSYAVNLGKITEHLVPFHANFLSQFNPKDARFIGSPIDLIVFDGYAAKSEELVIYFVEVKTGNSRLSRTQQSVKDAILKGQIRWAEINPDVSPLLEMKSTLRKNSDDSHHIT